MHILSTVIRYNDLMRRAHNLYVQRDIELQNGNREAYRWCHDRAQWLHQQAIDLLG